MNRISLQGILAMVSRRALLKLHKPHRAKEYVYSRAVFFKLARDFTRHSFKEIGEIVDKDHASVMHGMKVYDSLVFNKDLKYKYDSDQFQIEYRYRNVLFCVLYE